LAKVGYVDDVWMANRSRGACLPFKPRNRFALLHVLIAEYVGANSLHCYLASDQVLIAREVNLAHGAPP
jgi:hypothetical protein